MWQHFSKTVINGRHLIFFTFKPNCNGLRITRRNTLLLSLLLLFSVNSISKEDTSSLNPIFRDSVLNNKIDSAKWNIILNKIDIHKVDNHDTIIQKQKNADKSTTFLFISGIILMFLLLMRLLFHDFSFSLMEGIISFKKFLLFYQSKKYDSLLAVIFVYVLSIFILSLVTYIGLEHFGKDDFTTFKLKFFLKILSLLSLFFTLKSIIEFIFNWVIDTQQIFTAFFLQNLFSKFALSIILLFLLLIYIYNNSISPGFTAFILIFNISLYVVFNTIRSYQLMGNVRIPYKLHFFLYICAFKIIPMLLLFKYVLNNVVA